MLRSCAADAELLGDRLIGLGDRHFLVLGLDQRWKISLRFAFGEAVGHFILGHAASSCCNVSYAFAHDKASSPCSFR